MTIKLEEKNGTSSSKKSSGAIGKSEKIAIECNVNDRPLPSEPHFCLEHGNFKRNEWSASLPWKNWRKLL